MKLSKALLGALFLGITIPSVSSCSKKDKEVTPRPFCDITSGAVNTEQIPENGCGTGSQPFECPGCGMG